MHKRIEAELISLAHQILQMKDKDDVLKLKNIAAAIHEKLAVLEFVDNYFLATPNASENKTELKKIIENTEKEVKKQNVVTTIVEEKAPQKVEVKEETVKVSEELEQQNTETIKAEAATIVDKIVKQEEKAPQKVEVKEELVKISKELEKQNTEIIKAEAENIVNKIVEQEEKIPQKVEVKEETSKELEKQNAEIIKAEATTIVNKIVEQEEKFFKNDVKDVAPNSLVNNEEFKDSIPADVAANLFEKAEKLVKKEQPKKIIETPKPVQEEVKANIATKIEQKAVIPKQETKASLNDRLFNNKLQIGLNDRIAFVKHLFNFSQEDFNRVLSQLNTFETEVAAKDFLNNQVKLDYDWSGKEEYEERLIVLIERKFV